MAIPAGKDDKPHKSIQAGKDERRQTKSSSSTRWEHFTVYEPTHYFALSEDEEHEQAESSMVQPGTHKRVSDDKGMQDLPSRTKRRKGQ